jgi:hypothetical protein
VRDLFLGTYYPEKTPGYRVDLEIEFENTRLDRTSRSAEHIRDRMISLVQSLSQFLKVQLAPIASIICPEKIGRATHASTMTLKRMLSNAVDLTKDQFFRILSEETRLLCTAKIDGIRSIVTLKSDGSCHLFNNLEQVCIAPSSVGARNITYRYIADGELVGKTFYIFDVMVTNYDRVTSNFSDRVKLLKPLAAILNEVFERAGTGYQCYSKPFISLEELRGFDTYSSFLEVAVPWESCAEDMVDGIILTTTAEPYGTTKHYKWKPDLTVDLLVKRCPESLLGVTPYILERPSSTLYILFAGISRDIFKKYNFRWHSNHKNLCIQQTRGKSSYMPVTVELAINPLQFLLQDTEHKLGDLDGKIVEFNVKTGASSQIVFEPKQIRYDRESDYRAGDYFGNNLAIVESICMIQLNAISFGELKQTKAYFLNNIFTTGFYFAKPSNTETANLRQNMSAIKEFIFSMIPGAPETDGVVDFAGGGGKDILKFSRRKFKSICILDSNKNNICETVERKWRYLKSSALQVPLSLTTRQFNTISDEIPIDLIRNGVCAKRYLFVCSFAVHYMIDDPAKFKWFIQNIVKFADSTGTKVTLLFIFLNGNQIFEKLKLSSSRGQTPARIGSPDGVYEIQDAGRGYIDVRLPFQADMVRERLVNPRELQSWVKRDQVKQIKLASARDLLRDPGYVSFVKKNWPNLGPLSSEEEEYVSLVWYASFSISPKGPSSGGPARIRTGQTRSRRAPRKPVHPDSAPPSHTTP